jgi:hypothetical protein
MNAINMIGMTIGSLVVVERAGSRMRSDGKAYGALWKCKCVCGRECIRRACELRRRRWDNPTCGCRGVIASPGKCTRCSKQASPGLKRCDSCLRREREKVRTYRKQAAQMGMCAQCRCRIPREGIKTCDYCLRAAGNAKTGWCDDCFMTGRHSHDCPRERRRAA